MAGVHISYYRAFSGFAMKEYTLICFLVILHCMLMIATHQGFTQPYLKIRTP